MKRQWLEFVELASMEDNEILEIRTGSAGRYTVARRSFERGQTVLSEMAFEVALFEDCVPEYCDW